MFQDSAASQWETSTPRQRNRPNPIKTVESEVSVNQRPSSNRGVHPTVSLALVASNQVIWPETVLTRNSS